jgi:hypothetical protein
MHWQCELRVVQALRDLTEQLTTPVHPVDELGQGRLASQARFDPSRASAPGFCDEGQYGPLALRRSGRSRAASR